MAIKQETQITTEPRLNIPQACTTGQVVSADGTYIGYRQIGSGPGVVIMHGGMRASQHYLRLAQALAGSYTVIIPDRRGRGLSGPPGPDYSIEKEMADMKAVLQKTGARRLFGHSGGGAFALEVALRLPIQKLALYEPAVSIHGSMAFDWLPAFEHALDQNDSPRAFVLLLKGLQMGWMSHLPTRLLTPAARLLFRGEESRELTALLPTILWEAKAIQGLEQSGQTYERYQRIAVPTLLLSGEESPAYLRRAAKALAATLPLGRHIELGGLNHNAPDQNAPEVVAGKLLDFLG